MKLVYCATPSRISNTRKEIMDYVTSQGLGPFHPFQAFEYERFEGGPIGRERTMDFCRRAVDICDEFWLFGVSQGTLMELVYALSISKPIKLHLNFDPDWENHYKTLGSEHGNPLEKLL